MWHEATDVSLGFSSGVVTVKKPTMWMVFGDF